MAVYDLPRLASLLGSIDPANADADFNVDIVPYLTGVWLDSYTATTANWEIVQVSVEGFSYLFDVVTGRLVAAWGVSRGRHGGARPASRMAGHPLSAGPRYHRGHAIPHTLGGGTDLNLVAQLGSVNIGPFRPLERQAVATPGSLYFTFWIYGPGDGQTPNAVEQGLLVHGQRPDIRTHTNR